MGEQVLANMMKITFICNNMASAFLRSTEKHPIYDEIPHSLPCSNWNSTLYL